MKRRRRSRYRRSGHALNGRRTAAALRRSHIHDLLVEPVINDAIIAIMRPQLPEFAMSIGPSASARLLEVGIVATGDQDYVKHAMPARDRYLSMIDPSDSDRR
jgi:hypothetical protein